MNNYSTIHQNLVEYFHDDSLFDNLEKVLGYNWKTVLNFWWLIENMDESERVKIGRKFYKIEWGSWLEHLYNICSPYLYSDIVNIIHPDHITGANMLIFHVTIELIIMDKLFQKNQSLKLFPLFFQP